MKQNTSILLPLVSFLIGIFVTLQSFVTGNFLRLGFAAILIVGSSYVFKRNLALAETDFAAKLKKNMKADNE